MKKSRRKFIVSGCILFAVLAGTLILWPEPQHPLSVSTVELEKHVAEKTSTDWVEAIAASHPAEGIRLAQARGEMMRELIRTNPEQAVREALSLSAWSKLPPEIQACVEQPFSTVANVEVMIACGENSSQTTISTELPGIGKMETYVYGRRGGMDSKTGIPVQGIRVGKVGVLRENIFQPLTQDDLSAALGLFPVAVADPGGDSVATLAGGRLFYFKNRAAMDDANRRLAKLEELPGPNAGPQALFQSLDAYLLEEGGIDFPTLEELAYAATTEWTGSPRDMYVILVDFPDRPGQPTDPVAFSDRVNTTVSQQIWEMSYEKTHIVCTVNPTTYTMPLVNTAYTNNSLLFSHATNAVTGVNFDPYKTICVFHPAIDGKTYAGLASVGGQKMWLKSASADVVIHELGHNYGSSHASAWTNGVSSNPVEPAPAGAPVEYGDFTDIMGSGDAPEGHFNARHKKKISWLDADNWQSISLSGIYRVYRSDHRQTTGLVRGLEIEKGAGDFYWLGLRQEYTNYDTFSRGAYLIWKKAGDNRSYLLDTSPRSAEGKYDGGLALGQTYSDRAANVHITPTARGGQTPNEWMDITVHLGTFPGNSAPTASISGPTSGTVQSSMLFSVSASDPDGDELAYYWDTGDGLVKPNGPTIATAWLTGGTATVTCVVSDMKGGTTTVSQNVALTSALDNWTQRPSGTTETLRDIALGGGRLVAVGAHAITAYSDDGTNWTTHTSFDEWKGNISLQGVMYDGAQFIAVGQDYDFDVSGWEQTIYTSADGTSWTERYDSNTGNGSMNDIAAGNGYYVAVGDNGTIVRSTDGLSWNSVASGITTTLRGVSYGDGVFVAVGAASNGGSGVALTSFDGLSWTNNTDGTGLASWQGFYAVQYCHDRFLAGGWYARIRHSINRGQTFDSEMSGDRQFMPGFAYGNGTYFAAGLNKDNSDADTNLISTDGVNWTALSTASQENRNAAIYYNGTFITVGNNGAIWQSDPVGASAEGFAMWQLKNGVSLGLNRDPQDDADFDGYLNLTEYALGTTATDVGSFPVSDSSSSGTYFQVSYERDGIKGDIDYTIERATNLLSNDWNSANTVIVEDSASNLTVRSMIPMASQTNEFMRLELELK